MARLRSPGYPSATLETSLQYVEKIYSLNRVNPIDRNSAAISMGYSRTSGASDKMIANLSHYGLVEKAGKGEIKVTQLAEDILRPENDRSKKEALRKAAFNPQLFDSLQERFPDGHFSPDALKNVLARMGYQEKAIEPASKAYMDTCAYLKQLNAYESYDSPQSIDVESAQPEQLEKGFGVMDNVESMSAGVHPDVIAKPMPQFAGGSPEWEESQNERVVYCEEGEPGHYLKLVASGELDDYLLEAIEDFVKRQRKRLQMEVNKTVEPSDRFNVRTLEE